MKIGIDISILPNGGGVSKYVYYLLEGLKKFSEGHAYKLFNNSNYSIKLPLNKTIFEISHPKIPSYLLSKFWLYFRFPPIEWLIGDIDLFHSTAHTPIYASCPPARKWVVTVHDLFPIKLNYKKKSQMKEWIILKRIEKKANRVIAVSNSTRNDLLELLPALDDRTVVIHEGVNRRIFLQQCDPEIIKMYNIDTPYILYVGSAAAHKNIWNLLNTYKKLMNAFPHNLVLVGNITRKYQEVIDYVREVNLTRRVIFTGAVSENHLSHLYKGADLFVLPSLYEGFGLVILEAMASGTPVVASDIASIPEIGGTACRYFDPQDRDSMYETIRNVLIDRMTHSEMSERGKERAKLFSWDRAARETLKIYESL